MKDTYQKYINRLQAFVAPKLAAKKEQRTTHDWFVALTATTGFAVILCCIGVYVFIYTVGSESTDPNTDDLPRASFDREKLTEVVSRHEEQRKQFDGLRFGISMVPQVGDTPVIIEEEAVAEGLIPEGV